MVARLIRRLHGKEAGFTLIELMIVILVILILAAILIPQFGIARERARKASCVSNQRNIETAVAMWSTDNPSTNYTAGTMAAVSIPSAPTLTGSPQYTLSGSFTEPDDTGTGAADYYLSNGAGTPTNPSYGHVACAYDGYTDPWAGGHDTATANTAYDHRRGTSASP